MKLCKVRYMYLKRMKNSEYYRNVLEATYKEVLKRGITSDLVEALDKSIDYNIREEPKLFYEIFKDSLQKAQRSGYQLICDGEIQKYIYEIEKNEDIFYYPELLKIAGFLMGALIHLSTHEEIFIRLHKPWGYLGIFLPENKKLTIFGETLGENIGSYMLGGKMRIFGNIEGDLGYMMKDGRIEVYGDVKGDVGTAMKGGEIVVHGNVDGYVGSNMIDGKIILHGDAKDKVGRFMEGGSIKIYGNAYDVLALGMENGKIEVHGDAWVHSNKEKVNGEIYIYDTREKRESKSILSRIFELGRR